MRADVAPDRLFCRARQTVPEDDRVGTVLYSPAAGPGCDPQVFQRKTWNIDRCWPLPATACEKNMHFAMQSQQRICNMGEIMMKRSW